MMVRSLGLYEGCELGASVGSLDGSAVRRVIGWYEVVLKETKWEIEGV
jgi:hypothetical protein